MTGSLPTVGQKEADKKWTFKRSLILERGLSFTFCPATVQPRSPSLAQSGRLVVQTKLFRGWLWLDDENEQMDSRRRLIVGDQEPICTRISWKDGKDVDLDMEVYRREALSGIYPSFPNSDNITANTNHTDTMRSRRYQTILYRFVSHGLLANANGSETGTSCTKSVFITTSRPSYALRC